MDGIWASTDGPGDRTPRPSTEDFTLPSRGEALFALRPALESQTGPLLVTGEPGVGKTWLCRRLRAELPLPWRWVHVDVPPAIDPVSLYCLIGHRLGLQGTGTVNGANSDSARLVLADFLDEALADGARWALVLDEAHNASAAVLEEVRILSNRLGRRDGLSALVLVGQTTLACRLAIRPQRALAARLAAHVHLRCLDVEEARTLLNCVAPALEWDDRTRARHHRDAGGNPRRMLQAAVRTCFPAPTSTPHGRLRPRSPVASGSSQPLDLAAERFQSASGHAPAALDHDDQAPSMIGSHKPPLLVGDGMVEVGWEGALEAEYEPTAAPANVPRSLVRIETEPEPEVTSDIAVEDETVETVDDPLAALQAWEEWARNRVLTPSALAQGAGAAAGRREPAAETAGDPRGSSPGLAGSPSVWVEGEQGFAPYGQLFSRLRQSRDVNESS